MEDNKPDDFYRELQKIQECLEKQPDINVKKALIKEPYRNYFIKSYKLLKKLLNTFQKISLN